MFNLQYFCKQFSCSKDTTSCPNHRAYHIQLRADYHWTLQLLSNSGMRQKLSFKNSVDQICLVIANGYYEWHWLDPKGKAKQKNMNGYYE